MNEFEENIKEGLLSTQNTDMEMTGYPPGYARYEIRCEYPDTETKPTVCWSKAYEFAFVPLFGVEKQTDALEYLRNLQRDHDTKYRSMSLEAGAGHAEIKLLSYRLYVWCDRCSDDDMTDMESCSHRGESKSARLNGSKRGR